MALVVFLRGVNVGGHKSFQPTKLAEQLRHLDVVNIGAAGTMVARKRVGIAQLRQEVARRLPFVAEIMICQGRDIVRLLSQDFFPGDSVRPDIVRFVSVLPRVPNASPQMPMVFPARGQWLMKVIARDGRFVVGAYRRNMKAISFFSLLDRAFAMPLTTRNWNTMTAIAKVLTDESV